MFFVVLPGAAIVKTTDGEPFQLMDLPVLLSEWSGQVMMAAFSHPLRCKATIRKGSENPGFLQKKTIGGLNLKNQHFFGSQ